MRRANWYVWRLAGVLYMFEHVLNECHPDAVWHILDRIYDVVDEGHMKLLNIFPPRISPHLHIFDY